MSDHDMQTWWSGLSAAEQDSLFAFLSRRQTAENARITAARSETARSITARSETARSETARSDTARSDAGRVRHRAAQGDAADNDDLPSLPVTQGSDVGERSHNVGQETHTPRTMAAAQLLVQLPTTNPGTIPTPRGPQAVDSRDMAGACAMADEPRRQLDELSSSIDQCMNLIDRAQSQVPETGEHQELLMRIAQLEAQITAQQIAARANARSDVRQPTSRPLTAPNPRNNGAEALPVAEYDDCRDGPPPWNNPQRRHEPHRREGSVKGAGSEIEHHSVSEAHHPAPQYHSQFMQGGVPHADIQAMVARSVQECLRNMHSTAAIPQTHLPRDHHRVPYETEPPIMRRTPHERSPREELAIPRNISGSQGNHSSWMNRELRLPKFKGEIDENPLDFLTKFERFAAALSHLTLDQACRQCMPLALTDEAEQWLIVESKRWPLDYTYRHFSHALVDRFLPHDYVDRMRRFLETRMQGENEPLARFITVIETAYERMGIKASEQEVVQRISSQLNPTYNQLIGHRYFGSITELSQHARAVDAQVHRQKAFKAIEADCPDADLKVRNKSQSLPKPHPNNQPAGRRNNQRSNRGTGSGDTALDSKEQVGATTENAPADLDPDEEEVVPKVRLCYTCGDPSHLANKCPKRGDNDTGRRRTKNGDAPPSRQ
jgi:hypothetical protein